MTKSTTIKTNNTTILESNLEELLSVFTWTSDPKNILKKLSKDYNQYKDETSIKKKEKILASIQTTIQDSNQLFYYLKRHSLLADSTYYNEKVDFHQIAIDYTDELIQEYNCQTASQITTCQIVANAYIRIMRLSKLMLGYMQMPQEITDLKDKYYNTLSKELDRAERQYHMGLNMLRSFSQPQLRVNISTNNAFVAQNQQLNTTNENIKAN